eukprot:GHVR01025135.1.p1 GENE.GHVR01025135.1~~GHVR01025135.1.p1  ORF type:complete len:109 (-),score=0.41 GHVR01025135.1:658-984(-)
MDYIVYICYVYMLCFHMNKERFFPQYYNIFFYKSIMQCLGNMHTVTITESLLLTFAPLSIKNSIISKWGIRQAKKRAFLPSYMKHHNDMILIFSILEKTRHTHTYIRI